MHGVTWPYGPSNFRDVATIFGWDCSGSTIGSGCEAVYYSDKNGESSFQFGVKFKNELRQDIFCKLLIEFDSVLTLSESGEVGFQKPYVD